MLRAALLILALVGFTAPCLAEDNSAIEMDSNALAAASGGSESAVSQTVTSNTIGNVGSTGSISGVNAVGNSGMVTMIENSGNQVAISTSTVVNLNMR